VYAIYNVTAAPVLKCILFEKTGAARLKKSTVHGAAAV
jgi:hypothetical protein